MNANENNSCELVFTIDIKPEGCSRNINILKISSVIEIKSNGGRGKKRDQNKHAYHLHIIHILNDPHS